MLNVSASATATACRALQGAIDSVAHVSDKTNVGESWMPFHFQDGNCNWLTKAALDNICSTPEYKVCAVRVEKLGASA